MVKKLLVMICTLVLVACASEPSNKKGFSGTGNFDTVEAAKTRVSLGLTYLKNGNFSQAKFNLDKALDFAPRSGEAHYAMAFYYQQVGEQARAEEYYQTAISYSKNDPDVLNSYGAFLCKQGRYDDAKAFFLRAVDDKSYVSTASTYENLAICSQSQGRIEEAIQYFNSALNHQPTRPTSLIYLAQLYTDKQQWDDAKKALWKYERNASLNADSLWLSYQIAKGQNDRRASVEYADLLKRLYPDHENTKKAMSQIGNFQPDLSVTQKMPAAKATNTAQITRANGSEGVAEQAQNVKVQTDNTGQVPAQKSEEATASKSTKVLMPTSSGNVELDDASSKPLDTTIVMIPQNESQALDEQNNSSTSSALASDETLASVDSSNNIDIESLDSSAKPLEQASQANSQANYTNQAAIVAKQTGFDEVTTSEAFDDNDPIAERNRLIAENDKFSFEEVPESASDASVEDAIANNTIAIEGQLSEVQRTEAERAEAERTEALLAESLNSDLLSEPSSASTVEVADELSEVPSDTDENPRYHIVQPKENLYRISLKYNVKIPKLLEWNNLDNASNIQKGTRLLVRDPNSDE